MNSVKYGVWYELGNVWCKDTNGKIFENVDINIAYRYLVRWWGYSPNHLVKEMPDDIK